MTVAVAEQEKLEQRGVFEKGLERSEAVDRILARDNGNSTRCGVPITTAKSWPHPVAARAGVIHGLANQWPAHEFEQTGVLEGKEVLPSAVTCDIRTATRVQTVSSILSSIAWFTKRPCTSPLCGSLALL